MRNIISLDLGDYGWKLRGAEGLSFGTKEHAQEYATNHDLDDEPFLVDSRPTLGEVVKAIDRLEGRVWEEYVSVGGNDAKRQQPWPNPWDVRWIAVYVVTGGSEGWYLHVDVIKADNQERELLILGKTLCSSWSECYASAGRIAQLLGA